METTVTNFWKCFIQLQLDMLFAFKNRDEERVSYFFKQLDDHPAIIGNDLNLIIFFPFKLNTQAVLCFATQGLKSKKRCANNFIREAPMLDNWMYYAGVPPYRDNGVPFFLYFPFINDVVYENQVYVHVHRLYKTSNKLHLHIYMDLERTGVPKEKLKPFATKMLVYFLGEEKYYQNISMIKTVRRRVKKVNYIPLNELRNLIEFKSPY